MKLSVQIKKVFSSEPDIFKQPLRFFLKTIHFSIKLWNEFNKDRCLIRASSLSYSSLLALVPLTALVFSLLTAFGTFESIQESVQNFLFNQLLPTKQTDITEFINGFIANSKALGAIGLSLFAVTSIFLLNSITSNFNSIWGSGSRKNFIGQITTYSSVIVFGTLFIAASFTFTASLKSLFPFLEIKEINTILKMLFKIFPGIFVFLALLLMILIVPSAHIKFKSAVIGALAGAITWEISKTIFVNGTNYVLRASIIYGSLAAIPIFLIWLNIAWIIILTSLEITYIHQHKDNPWIGKSILKMEPSEKMAFGFDLFLFISNRFFKGEKPASIEELANIFFVPLSDIDHFINLFKKDGLILSVSNGNNGALLPAKALSTIPVKDVAKTIYGDPGKINAKDRKPLKLAYQFSEAAFNTFQDLTIEDVLSGGLYSE